MRQETCFESSKADEHRTNNQGLKVRCVHPRLCQQSSLGLISHMSDDLRITGSRNIDNYGPDPPCIWRPAGSTRLQKLLNSGLIFLTIGGQHIFRALKEVG